jgi:molybdopterin synthase sulfur carrier subunit
LYHRKHVGKTIEWIGVDISARRALMQIEVRLFATFREGRSKKEFLDMVEGCTVEDALKQLSIAVEDVAILLVNGRDGKFNNVLVDGTVLSVFPPVGGG